MGDFPNGKGIVLLGKQCLYKLVVAVVVDQAAVCDDLAFSVCQCSNRAFEWRYCAVFLDDVCINVIVLFKDGLADAWDKDVVA